MKKLVLIFLLIMPFCKADYNISDVPVGGLLVGVFSDDNASEDFATPASELPDEVELGGILLKVSLLESDQETVLDDGLELQEIIDVQEETLGGLYEKIVHEVKHKHPELGALVVSNLKRMCLENYAFVEPAGTKAVNSTLAAVGIREDDYLGIVLERCIE